MSTRSSRYVTSNVSTAFGYFALESEMLTIRRYRICRLALAGALLLVFLTTSGKAGPVLGEFFDKTTQINPGSSVSINNKGGSITVYGTGTNELSVSALKKAYSTARLAGIAVNVTVNRSD